MRWLLVSSAMVTPTKTTSIGMGFTLIGSQLTAFTLAGVGLDYWFGCLPWLTLVLTLIGIGASVLFTMRLLKQEEANKPGPDS